jgi:hypothetical protein
MNRFYKEVKRALEAFKKNPNANTASNLADAYEETVTSMGIGATPYAGDILDGLIAVKDLYKGSYFAAGVSTVAAVVPFFSAPLAKKIVKALGEKATTFVKENKAMQWLAERFGKKADDVGSEALRLSKANIKDSGITVIGPFNPETVRYINKAEAKNASFFSLGKIWGDVIASGEDPWKYNKIFLDEIAKKGDKVLLSIHKKDVKKGSYLAKEIDYLIREKKYYWKNQWTLQKR